MISFLIHLIEISKYLTIYHRQVILILICLLIIMILFLKIYKPSSKTNSEIKVSTISLDLNSSNLALKGNILPFFSSLIMDYRLIEFFDKIIYLP